MKKNETAYKANHAVRIISEREIRETLTTAINPEKTCIYDAMTPANFDWIYETIEKAAIVCRLTDSLPVHHWIAAMEMPVKSFAGERVLLPDLVEAIIEDMKSNPSVYERLDFLLAILSQSNSLFGNRKAFKERMRKDTESHFKAIRMTEEDAAREDEKIQDLLRKAGKAA